MITTTEYPLPTYVYKILPTAPPLPIPAVLPLSELDQKDGFIHLSNASQVPITASLFFKSNTELWLLKIDTRKTIEAGGVYRWVDNLPGCPHLYAPKEGEWIDLGSRNVVSSVSVTRQEGQAWEDALGGLKESGWLVDE
ncbi:hypothetical protein BD309DRAFT_958319 [Dichomitus squalens]|uniref:Uncharacterized protein n=1 Tax=Dichomitus squalens TaxID=114155 RepID=A0A4Q9NUV1_9APHY|nr:hypothetical protein BD309DRAFT_958319 [Dichomitus squalens]TBU54649.1 hypothetical protein BD310DRAFT_935458 [Dichomitus squalens]